MTLSPATGNRAGSRLASASAHPMIPTLFSCQFSR